MQDQPNAYDLFPADQFDAWVDGLRGRIIQGLEPRPRQPTSQTLQVPELSERARKVVETAKAAAAAKQLEYDEARRDQELIDGLSQSSDGEQSPVETDAMGDQHMEEEEDEVSSRDGSPSLHRIGDGLGEDIEEHQEARPSDIRSTRMDSPDAITSAAFQYLEQVTYTSTQVYESEAYNRENVHEYERQETDTLQDQDTFQHGVGRSQYMYPTEGSLEENDRASESGSEALQRVHDEHSEEEHSMDEPQGQFGSQQTHTGPSRSAFSYPKQNQESAGESESDQDHEAASGSEQDEEDDEIISIQDSSDEEEAEGDDDRSISENDEQAASDAEESAGFAQDESAADDDESQDGAVREMEEEEDQGQEYMDQDQHGE